jgi:hypothetical protein
VEPTVRGQELPLACSLDPAELDERKKLMRSIAAAGVEGVEKSDTALSIRFRRSSDLKASLERLIALEGECCPFLEFQLSEEDGALTLAVEAPGGPATALDAIRHMLASPVS